MVTVCQAVAMLQVVETLFNKRSSVLLQMIPYMLSTVQARMFSTLEPLKRKLEAEMRLAQRRGSRDF